MTQLPRGLRNNNPGNIRLSKDKWQGLRQEQTDGTFFQFIAPMWGYRALIRTIQNYHRLHGCRTIAEYINRWAPATENHTSGYISAVCREMQVPTTFEELLALPGVGRKTANLILGDIYGQEGYVCDTHCIRITGRLGLTDGSKDPLSVEKQLRAILPPEKSNDFCHRLVLFGRDRCTARKANCDGCPLRKDCDYGKAQK